MKPLENEKSLGTRDDETQSIMNIIENRTSRSLEDLLNQDIVLSDYH